MSIFKVKLKNTLLFVKVKIFQVLLPLHSLFLPFKTQNVSKTNLKLRRMRLLQKNGSLLIELQIFSLQPHSNSTLLQKVS